MISIHLDDPRGAAVKRIEPFSQVTLYVGARGRVALMVRSDAQARIIAEAINAAVNPDAPILHNRIGGA